MRIALIDGSGQAFVDDLGNMLIYDDGRPEPPQPPQPLRIVTLGSGYSAGGGHGVIPSKSGGKWYD